MNIKELAIGIAESVDDGSGEQYFLDPEGWIADFAEALVAELAKENEPVYAFRRKGLDDFCTCDERRYNELVQKPALFEVRVLYTLPPTAEQIEQETAEAIAAMLHSNANKCYLTSDAFVLKANASLIIDGAWKEYK